MSGFKKATKEQKKLVISVQGASGAGKTYSALAIASHLCPAGKRVAYIDTENSASLYADKFDFDVDSDFGGFGKINYHPDQWTRKLMAAADAGEYGVVVLDSLTHMWKGPGGILDVVENAVKAAKARGGKGDSFAAWKDADPLYTKFMNNLRQLPFHTIFCLRSKQATEKAEVNGRMTVRKVGLEPEFRDGFDYDVDAQMLIDDEHTMIARKHRLGEYLDGRAFPRPGQELAQVFLSWAEAGAPQAAPTEKVTLPSEAAAPPTNVTVAPKTTTRDVNELLAKFDACKTKAEVSALGKESNPHKGEYAPEDWKKVIEKASALLKSLGE